MSGNDFAPLLKLHYTGTKANIYFCRPSVNSNFNGSEYLETLSESGQNKFEAILERLAEVGHISNTEKFNSEGDGIWFIKIHGHRLACFKHVGDWIVITSGFKKDPKDKTRKQQVERAARIRAEFLASERNQGTQHKS